MEHDPLAGRSRQEWIDIISDALKGRVEQAWIFGSFASCRMHRYSDIDLMLVTETLFPFTDRPKLFDDIYDLGPEMDILVYTPNEFDKILQNPPGGFWMSVKKDMKRIL